MSTYEPPEEHGVSMVGSDPNQRQQRVQQSLSAVEGDLNGHDEARNDTLRLNTEHIELAAMTLLDTEREEQYETAMLAMMENPNSKDTESVKSAFVTADMTTLNSHPSRDPDAKTESPSSGQDHHAVASVTSLRMNIDEMAVDLQAEDKDTVQVVYRGGSPQSEDDERP